MSNLISEVIIRKAEDILGIMKKEIDHKELNTKTVGKSNVA